MDFNLTKKHGSTKRVHAPRADKAIGNRFRQAREYLKISVDQMAILFGTSSRTIRNVEQGKQMIPFEWIYILCRFFDINANWLLTGKEHMCLNCFLPFKEG